MTDNDAAITGELTPREGEVLAMVAAGLTNREIGEALFISESTAGVHVSHIMAKLGVGSRTEVAAWAYRAGLVDAPTSAIPTEGPSAASATSDAAAAPSGWLAGLRAQLRQHPSRVAPLGIAGVMILAVIATALAIAVFGGARPVAGDLPSASGSPTGAASASPSVKPSASPSVEPSAAPSNEESPPVETPSPTPIPLPNGTWSVAGAMSLYIQNHTATLLNDGTVLVAGGERSGDTQASAELYHPDSGEWTTTGDMVTDRTAHSATLLRDGTVLVAGGTTRHVSISDGIVLANADLAAAELFDPRTGEWHATSPMNAARAWHTATLLANGTVVVAGGSADGNVLASAEIYDPQTATWTSVQQMADGRMNHTATRLNDGTVLVAGGSRANGTSVAIAALYDPESRTWSAAGRMIMGRNWHTATLLEDGTVLVAGGQSDIGPQASAEIYNRSTNSWTSVGSMAEPRTMATATLLHDGTVLVVGGITASGVSASAEVYEPSNGQWAATAPLLQARARHTATLLTNGDVLVSGGDWSGEGLPQVTFLYDPDGGP
jgi:DNA-binding CsgD family transcriptional regulator/N-acetylneuraminic acid mutarotase